MKIKRFKKIMCFLLALVVLLAMPLDIRAQAVAVELGWVTWALISFLTAMGFTFTVAGGIQALQTEVEEKVDTYYEFTGIDLFGLLDQLVRLKTGGGGNGGGFWFSAAASYAVIDFAKWVLENGWSAGSEVENTINELQIDVLYNGVAQKLITCVVSPTSGTWKDYRVNVDNEPTIYPVDSILSTSKNNGLVFYNVDTGAYRRFITHPSYDEWRFAVFSSADKQITYATFEMNTTGFGKYYTVDDIVGVIFGTTTSVEEGGTVGGLTMYYYMNDGYAFRITSGFYYVDYAPTAQEVNASTTIEIPQETNDFEVEQSELVEIDFSVFENDAPFTSPEELAQAVKQELIDTGTVPTIKTEVITDPDTLPEPTPAPTPVPSPEIEDIEDLGLPTLGEALFNKFPFSLPRDLKRIAGILNAEPVAPFWEVDLFAPLADDISFQGDTSFTIDLAEYETLGQISRWASVISFCIMLIIITKGVIKW